MIIFKFVNAIYHIHNRYSQYYDYLITYGRFHMTKFTFLFDDLKI